MAEHANVQALPKFLESFENLAAHFDERFGELGSNERGDTFLDLALKVISLTDEGHQFPPLRPSEKKSHDGGVDLLSKHSLLAPPRSRVPSAVAIRSPQSWPYRLASAPLALSWGIPDCRTQYQERYHGKGAEG